MDIELLKRKRTKSVQDQNAISKYQIMSVANWWNAGNRLPEPIESMIANSGITRESAVLVEEHSGPECCAHSYSGCFLTMKNEFWSYEVDLNHQETEIEYLEQWLKIDVEVNQHQKGTGKSFGYLCTEVLSEIEN
jgi:hypothetical protein